MEVEAVARLVLRHLWFGGPAHHGEHCIMYIECFCCR